MKDIKIFLLESQEVFPVLCLRLNDENVNVLFYTENGDSVKYIILDNKSVPNTKHIDDIVKTIRKCGYDGYKTAEKLDCINDLVELKKFEMDNIGYAPLKEWFKNNGYAQRWIVDAQ